MLASFEQPPHVERPRQNAATLGESMSEYDIPIAALRLWRVFRRRYFVCWEFQK